MKKQTQSGNDDGNSRLLYDHDPLNDRLAELFDALFLLIHLAGFPAICRFARN
jgi:hypothetical protein